MVLQAAAILIRVMKQRQYTDLRPCDLNLNCFGITKDVATHVRDLTELPSMIFQILHMKADTI